MGQMLPCCPAEERVWGKREGHVVMRLTRWRVHPYRRWREGVGRREEKRTPVLAAGVRGPRWAGEDVMPFQDVGF